MLIKLSRFIFVQMVLLLMAFYGYSAQSDGNVLNHHMIWIKIKPVEIGYIHAAFRKTFSLSSNPANLSLKIFAYTRYQLFINGKYVLRGPSRYENKRPEYDELNVASYLRKGVNTVAVMVHRDQPTGRIMQHEPGLALLLSYHHKTIVSTDSTWKGVEDNSYGPQKKSWSSIAEHIDATKLDPDWITEKFDDSSWQMCTKVNVSNRTTWPKIFPRSIPLLKETVVQPVNMSVNKFPATVKAGDSLVINYPRILQAYPLINLNTYAGSSFEMRFTLPNNSSTGINTYTTKSGSQDYRAGDTYAYNKLILKVSSGSITFNKISTIEVLYPFTIAGSFSCNDTILNKTWTISAATLKLLSEDAYVDCADRERVEWMDCDPPAYDCTRVMMATHDEKTGTRWSDPRLIAAMLRRIAITQRDDGMIKAYTCSDRIDKHTIMEDRACDWVEGLKKYYDHTGDKKLINELWPNVIKLLNWFIAHQNADGLVKAREWVTWDNPARYQIFEGAALNAFVYSAYKNAAYLGKEIGKLKQAAVFNKDAEKLASSFNKVLWNSKEGSYNGGYYDASINLKTLTYDPAVDKSKLPEIVNRYWPPTLHAALFALDKKLVPANRRASVLNWLAKHTDESVAPMSQYFLYKLYYSLNRAEMDTAVVKAIAKNWQEMTASEWKTTWESFKMTRYSSKVHVYGMVPAYYLSAYVLGVRLAGSVTNKKIIINPRLCYLKKASGTVVTEFGLVKVNWQKENNGSIAFSFNIPKGIKALVSLPAGPEKTIAILKLHRQTIYKNRKSLILGPGNYSGRSY